MPAQNRPRPVIASWSRLPNDMGSSQSCASGWCWGWWATPTASVTDANPRPSSSEASSAVTRAGADGSWSSTLPSCTAVAPAASIASASAPVRTPPPPTIGRSGNASCRSHTDRRARVCTAGPLSSPVPAPSAGRSVSGSMASPGWPPPTTTRVGSVLHRGGADVDGAGTGSQLGEQGQAVRKVAAHDDVHGACRVWKGSVAPRRSSTAPTPGLPPTRRASSPHSPSVSPEMLTTTRSRCRAYQGSSVARKPSRPAFWSPLQASTPPRRLDQARHRRPACGSSVTVRVTSAPTSARSTYAARSAAAAAGGGHDRRRHGEVAQPGGQVGSSCAPRSRGTVPTSAQRTRSPRNTGPSAQARTIRATPSSPTTGTAQPWHSPVRAGQRHLDRGLAPGAVRPRRPRRRACRTSAAGRGVDHVGRRPGPAARRATSADGVPRCPTEPSPVTTVTRGRSGVPPAAESRCASSAAASSRCTTQPRSRSRSASGNSGPRRSPRPTSRHVTGSLGSANGRPSGPVTATPRSRRQRPRSQRGADADRLVDHDLDGGAVAAGRARRGGSTGRVERGAQPVGAPPARRRRPPRRCPGRKRSATPGATRVRCW